MLCPGTVATSLFETSNQFRPSGPVPGRAAAPGAVRSPPAEIAEQVLQAIQEDRFWILTHDYREQIERRTRGIVETGEVVVPTVV